MGLLIDAAYMAVILAASPLLLYRMATRRKYRAGFLQRFGNVPRRTGDKRCLWIHAVSVGEAKIAGILIRELEEAFPNWDIVLSTTTHTGREIVEKEQPGRTVFYCPLDFSWATARTIRRIRPDCLILIELELWPNLLRSAKKADIPVVVVNGRITEKAAGRYGWLARIAPWVFRDGTVRLFAVQNATYAERLSGLGVAPERIRVTGTMKYDAMTVGVGEATEARVRKLLGMGERELAIVGASVYSDEVSTLAALYGDIRREFPEARLVLVPRHMEQLSEMILSVEREGLRVLRRSAIREGSVPDLQSGEVVVMVDTMGELIDICSIAACVFVGKSLHESAAGGHNMLEPAGLGKAVLFGPHTSNFEEDARLLLDGQGAIRVQDAEGLKRAILDLLGSEGKRKGFGERARELVVENMGATKRTIDQLKQILL